MRYVSLLGLAFALAAPLLAAACGDADAGGGGPPVEAAPVDEARAAVGRDLAPPVSEAEAAALARDERAFAFDLYARAREDASLAGRNVVFSPLSIVYALAMTSAGARGTTLDEMHAALRFSLPQERLHPALNALSLDLARRPAQALEAPLDRYGDVEGTLEYALVNSVWAQRGLAIETPFLETLAGSYDAGVKLVDFRGQPEAARAAINDWVESATGDRIVDLLPPDSIDGSTRMVLVNALALAAPWAFGRAFKEFSTSDGTFTRTDGTSATLPMMYNVVGEVPYAADGDVEVAALPLLGGRLSVVIALPAAGAFERVEAAFGAERFEALTAAMAPRTIDLALPKFSLRSASLSLKPMLEALGMRAAFSAADFSGITGDTSLFVDDVLHQTTLGFDELGIEAAAATAVGLAESGRPSSEGAVPFAVDRPFFVGIRDATTGVLLFWGRIVDPTG